MLAFGVRIIFISLLGICGMVTQLMADNNLLQELPIPPQFRY